MILGVLASAQPTTEGVYPEDFVEGYGTPPAAAFTASVLAGSAPLVVQFSDTSAGSPTSWLWLFGDGTTSTLRHPSHIYEAGGPYTVTLTATGEAGSTTFTRPAYITVGGFGINEFGISPYGG